MKPETIRQNFDAFSNSKTPIPFDELAKLFDELKPLGIKEVLGAWKGGVFKSGKPIDLPLKNYGFIKWIGKNFKTENNVNALMYKFLGIPFNFPIIGKARARRIEFRAKVSTAMIYNYLPIIDHFRKVDDATLMGVMELKGKVILYFYLYR